MRGHCLTNQPLLVKDESSEVVTMELNVPSMKQATKNKGFLELVSSDSTAFDENSTSTIELIFDEADHYSTFDAANDETYEKPETSVDKFPCMSAKSALLLSEEETHDYHPNSPMLESCERKQRKTFKLYHRFFNLLHTNRAVSPSERRFSQVYDSTTATKSTPPSKNHKASTKGNFFALVNGVNDSTCRINAHRRLITLPLLSLRKTSTKDEPKGLMND
jgi:hypothetical protein